MNRIFKAVRRFFASMGLVEQSQVVASTAVIVAMVTIVTTHFVSGYSLKWIDLMSVIAVGVIGFFSVYFSLKYGRMLEDQRRELLELNTITEAVNHSVELNYVLQGALAKVMELMHADCGWIYLNENHILNLKLANGTAAPFFLPEQSVTNDSLQWLRRPALLNISDPVLKGCTIQGFQNDGMVIIASIPLIRAGSFAGVLIIGSRVAQKFESKKIALIQAFGNQISVALNNASLYEQAKESERQYADLYEHSPDMYHSVNRSGFVVSCNMTESQLLGMPKSDIIGRPLINIYPTNQHEKVKNNLRRIFELGQELKSFEEQVQRSDGKLIDVSVNTSLVYDANGNPTIVRMVLRDITLKKKLDEKILQAQKMDSIGGLTAGIAHNFNNILTAILNSASIMRRKINNDERLIKYVELIETTSRRGAALTRQLSTFARKSSPQFDPVDLNSIIDQTIKLFEATAPKSIHVEWTPSPSPVIVLGDEMQLQQAFLNICLNARDAMPNGGILVVTCTSMFLDEDRARQFPDIEPGDFIEIKITDSGTGIPPEIMNRIFEPLFTTKDPGKGTGLGLSLVYGIVRSHHGNITVTSEVGSTCFTIYLPHAKQSNAAPVGVHTAPVVGGKERILLVEDELSVGVVGVDILRDLGYSVDIACDGLEAESKISQDRDGFDLMVLDINMPRGGGEAAFKSIKKLSPNLKVLVCSGYTLPMLENDEFVKSIDDFIQKPYELEEFAQKIRATLDRRAAAKLR